MLLVLDVRGHTEPGGADHQRSTEEDIQSQHSAVCLCACVVRPRTIAYYEWAKLMQMGVLSSHMPLSQTGKHTAKIGISCVLQRAFLKKLIHLLQEGAGGGFIYPHKPPQEAVLLVCTLSLMEVSAHNTGSVK